jgi:putative transposase
VPHAEHCCVDSRRQSTSLVVDHGYESTVQAQGDERVRAELPCHLLPKASAPRSHGAVKTRLEEIIRNVAKDIDAEVLALEVMPDHVHLFVSAVLQMAPNQVVGRFKGASSRILRQEFPHLLRLPSLWTQSSFISTSGNVSSGTIQKYIEAQSKR